ncbi:MAG TPA: hypothetical protein VGK10_07545 [Prolixibacteraceae bacterium]|jgi:hypothetical protein
MKKLLIACLVLFGAHQLKAQDGIQQSYGYHQHDGFYLSMNLGPVFGNIRDDVKAFQGASAYNLDMSGSGTVMDLKIGGAIRENLILHATLISNLVSAPNIVKTTNNYSTSGKQPQSFSISEDMYGAGLTYYAMPSNLFVSGSIGLGTYTVLDKGVNNTNITTQGGFSMQLKMGKEWWVSKNWGLGVGLTYSKTNVNNDPSNGESEVLNSDRFGILFNTTFN